MRCRGRSLRDDPGGASSGAAPSRGRLRKSVPRSARPSTERARTTYVLPTPTENYGSVSEAMRRCVDEQDGLRPVGATADRAGETGQRGNNGLASTIPALAKPVSCGEGTPATAPPDRAACRLVSNGAIPMPPRPLRNPVGRLSHLNRTPVASVVSCHLAVGRNVLASIQASHRSAIARFCSDHRRGTVRKGDASE